MVYLGTESGGVFQNTKKTLTGWSAKPVGLLSGKINALAHTGTYLFAAAGDKGVFRFTGYVGSDRYWEKVNSGLTSLNVSALIALDSISLIAGTSDGKLFKTSNKGESWAEVNNLPFSSSKITGFAKVGNKIILTVQTKGVFVSTDNGASWQDFNDLNTANVQGTNSLSYNSVSGELMVLNANGLFLMSSVSSSSTPAYIAVSNMNSTIKIRSISNNGTNWYLATSEGVFASLVTNISWAAINNGLSSLDVNVLIPFQNQLLAGTNKAGIFKTNTDTVLWVANNATFNNVKTYSMATKGENLIVAATENGVFVSADLASNYKRANQGLTDSLNVSDLTFFGTKLFASTLNNGVFVSNDNGSTWTVLNSGLINLNIKKVFASAKNIYCFDSNGKVFQSSGSSSWLDISEGLSGNLQPTAMAFSGTTVYLSSLGQGIYAKKEDVGKWEQINNGLNNKNLTSVTAFGNKIFVGTDGNGVWSSDNKNVNWQAAAQTSIPHTLTMNLDGSKIQAMASFGGYVFASYKGGLLASNDEGKTWIQGGNQFNLPSFTDVNKISFVTTRVFVTTENNALYSNSLSEVPLNVGIDLPVNPTHKDSCNGSLTAFFTGGTAPYKILWSTNDTTATISKLCPGKYIVTITDKVNAVFSDTIELKEAAISTGILANNKTPESFKVYPNPSNGDFTIKLTDSKNMISSISVYNQIGILMDKFTNVGLSNELKVSINYPKGIYIIHALVNDQSLIQKIIVE